MEAERAVTIDPDCGACHGTLGLFLFYHAWQWERAETHLRKAIELEPGAASIRPSFAMLLVASGRTGEALAQIDAALKDHPHELVWHVIRSSILYSSRRHDEAIAAADKALALDDRDRGGWEWRSRALFQAGRGDEAIRALAKVAFAPHAAALESAVARKGWQGGLRLLLASTGDWQARDEQLAPRSMARVSAPKLQPDVCRRRSRLRPSSIASTLPESAERHGPRRRLVRLSTH